MSTARRPLRRRTKLVLVGLALVLLELFAKGALFASPRERLLSVDSSSGRRILWVRGALRRSLERRALDVAGPGYALDVHDPLLGWAPRPAVQRYPQAPDAPVSTTSLGFRGTRELADPKRAPRVLFLGDSFTFGEKVGDGQTFPEQAARHLAGVEIVNLGVHGYGHDQMLLRLERDGLPLEPDGVVLGFVSLDVERNLLSFRDFAKPRARLDGSGAIEIVGVPVPTPRRLLLSEALRWHTLDLARVIGARLEARGGRRDARAERVTRALIREMRDRCAERGATFAMVFLPWYEEIAAPGVGRGERFFESVGAELGIPTLDLGPRFRERHAAGQPFRKGHWGAAEHHLAAEPIARFLLEHIPALAAAHDARLSSRRPSEHRGRLPPGEVAACPPRGCRSPGVSPWIT